jgi:hypothetical protein
MNCRYCTRDFPDSLIDADGHCALCNAVTMIRAAQPPEDDEDFPEEEYGDPVGYDEPEESCPNCGKVLEDFSDLGCGQCDQRSPEWGIILG